MTIGIVSNSSNLYIPLLSYLYHYKHKAGVLLYAGKSTNPENSPAETAKFCKAAGVLLTFENENSDLYSWQQLYQPDIIFFSGYSHIVKTDRFDDVRYGIYNIHFGFLPEFRGPSPIFWQLRKGQKELGLVIHKMTDKLDGGAIVWQHKIENQPHLNYDFLTQLFADLQCKGVASLLEAFNAGVNPAEKQQDESTSAYFKKPQLNDVMIEWEKMNAAEILDLIKACNPWNFGATTAINGFELKIMDAVIKAGNSKNLLPGQIIAVGNELVVACIGNQLLSILFFKIGNTFVPARFAGQYGFKPGQKFANYGF